MYQFVVRLLEPHTILVLLAGVALFRLWRSAGSQCGAFGRWSCRCCSSP